jgi:hypothetical protein
LERILKKVWEGPCSVPTHANNTHLTKICYISVKALEKAEMQPKMKKYVYVVQKRLFLRKKLSI